MEWKQVTVAMVAKLPHTKELLCLNLDELQEEVQYQSHYYIENGV